MGSSRNLYVQLGKPIAFMARYSQYIGSQPSALSHSQSAVGSRRWRSFRTGAAAVARKRALTERLPRGGNGFASTPARAS